KLTYSSYFSTLPSPLITTLFPYTTLFRSLTHQLTSPKKEVDKEYYAIINGIVTTDDIIKFKEGFLLKDQEEEFKTLPAKLEILEDRKSTRLNSSHVSISYAVFCLKKKKKK